MPRSSPGRWATSPAHRGWHLVLGVVAAVGAVAVELRDLAVVTTTSTGALRRGRARLIRLAVARRSRVSAITRRSRSLSAFISPRAAEPKRMIRCGCAISIDTSKQPYDGRHRRPPGRPRRRPATARRAAHSPGPRQLPRHRSCRRPPRTDPGADGSGKGPAAASSGRRRPSAAAWSTARSWGCSSTMRCAGARWRPCAGPTST